VLAWKKSAGLQPGSVATDHAVGIDTDVVCPSRRADAPRIGDLMTRDHLAFMDSSNAAERAGDAATALEYHQGIPMFRRSAHRVTLEQLADLAHEMTPWLWARWAAYQCTRAEDPGKRLRCCRAAGA
jgi:hypothetical protein